MEWIVVTVLLFASNGQHDSISHMAYSFPSEEQCEKYLVDTHIKYKNSTLSRGYRNNNLILTITDIKPISSLAIQNDRILKCIFVEPMLFP